MTYFFRANNLISSNQHGFLSRRSTVTQLLETFHDWCISVNSKKLVDVFFADFCKAFDSVVHSKLIKKLSKYGISGHLLRWIQCFLSDRSQCVRVGSETSYIGQVVSGVPQGSVLGPLLFLIFVNDISSIVPANVSCKLYADDAKFYQSFTPTENDYSLDVALIALHDWSVRWQLPLATAKCHVLHLSNANPKKLLCFTPISP